MATGLTYKIEERDVSFKEFVWDCARSFGAFADQRDESGPLKLTNEEDSYHTKRLAESVEEFDKLLKMTSARKEKEAQKANEAYLNRYNEALAKYRASKARYEALIAEAEAWNIPSPEHKNLKEFILQQLKDSLGCLREPTLTVWTVQEWYEAELNSAKWDIDYHMKEQSQHKEVNKGRQKWIDDLVKSVGAP